MFLAQGTLNPNNENYLVKTIGSKLKCVIHDSTINAIANLIFLANIPAPDRLIQYLQSTVTSICLLCWYSGFTKRKLPRKCIKSTEVCQQSVGNQVLHTIALTGRSAMYKFYYTSSFFK